MAIALANFQFRPALKLALPKEHGSWSLALEPLALGLLAAPSVAGIALALAALAGFFMRRPLKLAVNGKADPRRWQAINCTVVLGAMATFSCALMVILAHGVVPWLLFPAGIAGLFFIWADLRNAGRDGAAELCGTIAFGILPAAFAILAGWSFTESLALAAVMLARSIPTVLTVRTYLRHHKGHNVWVAPAVIASIGSFLVVAWLVMERLAPWAAVGFMTVLAAFTVFVLADNRRFSARSIGIAEMILGIAMVVTLAFTWR